MLAIFSTALVKGGKELLHEVANFHVTVSLDAEETFIKKQIKTKGLKNF